MGGTDKSETEATAICKAANLQIRKYYSYANLLYEQIRCGFAHAYQAGNKATESDQLRGIAGVDPLQVSYVNRAPDTGNPADIEQRVIERVIHFPLEWIIAVAESVAAGMDRERERHGKAIFENLGLEIQARWWRQDSP